MLIVQSISLAQIDVNQSCLLSMRIVKSNILFINSNCTTFITLGFHVALVAKGQFLFIRPFTVLLDSRNNMGYQITRIAEYQLCMYL